MFWRCIVHVCYFTEKLELMLARGFEPKKKMLGRGPCRVQPAGVIAQGSFILWFFLGLGADRFGMVEGSSVNQTKDIGRLFSLPLTKSKTLVDFGLVNLIFDLNWFGTPAVS